MNTKNDKPPVMLVHGMWSTPQTLDQLRQTFEKQGYEVHVPCLPFHETFDKMDENKRRQLARCSISDYLSHLENSLLALSCPPVLVGHSMGGILAQLLASKHKCERLILLSSAPSAGMNGWTFSVVRTLGDNLLKLPLWKTTMSLKSSNIRYGIANSQLPSLQQEIAKSVTLESGRVVIEIALWFVFMNPPTRVQYQDVKCPILIIAGTEDKITPLKVQRKTHARYGRKSTLIEFEGVCHWTIGGTNYPIIESAIFNWLSADNHISAA